MNPETLLWLGIGLALVAWILRALALLGSNSHRFIDKR